jgi:hypothetical protein
MLALALVATLVTMLIAVPAAPAAAQAPGDYPHLVLSDDLHPEVPGPGGPWDNSHVFETSAGQSFDARISYQAVGQLNTNVFWALLVSATPTPYPTTLVPPPLLTMPPFVLVLAPTPSLSLDGSGQLQLFVPAGLSPIDVYIQGLVYDVTNAPALQLSNGLRVDIEAPDLSVRFAFLRSQPTGPEGQLGDAGVIDIDASQLKTLKPLGPNPPPPPVEVEPPPPGTTISVENPLGVPYSFLPIVANAPDAPVNPLARPLTTIVGNVTSGAATITVEDTSFFPSRGRLLIALGSSKLWTTRDAEDVANAEVVVYTGKTRTSFLNCQRMQVGTQADSTDMKHLPGETVVGEFTLATTAGARERTRIGLDADNPHLPHVVLPDIEVAPPEGGAAETRSLDLYRFEREDGVQGFMTFERGSGQWREIPGTAKGPSTGIWDPMVCVAPDHKSFVAVLRVSTGVLGWNNDPDQIWAVRLDGGLWPANEAEAWRITYQLTPDPGFLIDNVQSRRAVPRSFAIVGPDAENFVLYAGLAYKWKLSQPLAGIGSAPNGGFEAEYIREEVLVKDLIECPLVPPDSAKTPPAMPRPYMVSQFGLTGTGFPVVRFDPELLVSSDHTRLLVVGGRAETEEDAFVIRNVSVTAGGTVSKILVNASGAAQAREIHALSRGGHGQGGKAAFSPSGTRVAYLVKAGTVSSTPRRDWIDIAQTSGASYGQVKHVYADSSGAEFKEPGAYTSDRVVSGLHFIDESRLVFLMGRNPYDNPLGTTAADSVAMDWFAYDITTGVMKNLSRSYAAVPPPATTFTKLGTLAPGGYFQAPGGNYSYMLRFGGLSASGGSSLPAGTPVANVLGLEHQTLGVFAATGDEFGATSVDNLVVPASECRAPVETAAAMRFAEGFGAQEGMLYFTAHVVGGNDSDEVVALNRNAPFVALQATSTGLAGVHVRNVAVDPWSGKVAFSRSGTSVLGVANEHPYVVDLDSFLFERDLLPTWMVSGSPIGRVMDGSFQFIGPSGSADEALAFAFGLDVTPQSGVAQTAPPAYYSLSAVSDPLAEPIPVVIPLIDTGLLGADFRFYVLAAGPSTGN